MNVLMKMAMISCRQSVVLAAKASVNALTFGEGIKLKIHTKMCKACKEFNAENALIDDAIEKILKEKEHKHVELSAAQKERILKILD